METWFVNETLDLTARRVQMTPTDRVALTEADDEELLRGCRRRDDEAWAALVGRYQRLVRHVSRQAGLDESLAAEVAQHVFTMLVGQIDHIEEPARIGAWLVTTARREAWRLGRRERAARLRHAHPRDDGALPEPIDLTPLPEEALLTLEEQRRVRRALAALDRRCHCLLTLLFYRREPPPYTEVAAALGVPVGSIGPTRARCLRKLRLLLEPTVDDAAS